MGQGPVARSCRIAEQSRVNSELSPVIQKIRVDCGAGELDAGRENMRTFQRNAKVNEEEENGRFREAQRAPNRRQTRNGHHLTLVTC
jgi:hypothetical protein